MNTLGRVLRYMVDAWRYATRAAPDTVSALLLPSTSITTVSLDDAERAERARKLAVTSAWAYSAIRLIAHRVAEAMADVEVMEYSARGKGEKREEHEILDLLARPNDVMGRAFLFRYTVNWLLLMGNAYIVIVTPQQGSGTPLELWPLPADRVRPLPHTLRRGQGVFANRVVIDYEYTADTQIVTLPGESVIHLRMPNPFDYWEGLSPLSAAMMGLEVDRGQATWVRSFFTDDNAVPANIVSLPQGTPQPIFEAVKQQLIEEFGGKRKTLVTRGGDITVQVIQQTLEQMQILQSREFTRDEIDRVFGIPQGLLSGSLSGDSRIAANTTFARETLQPLINDIVDELNKRLVPYYGDNVELVPPNVVPEDRMLLVQEYRTYSPDRTINENRAVQGLPPIDKPWADIPVRLLAPLMRSAPPGFGLPAPEQMAQMLAGREARVDDDLDVVAGKAMELAMRHELQQWQKVALRAVREVGDPLAREFVADVLPADVVDRITDALTDASTPQAVKDVFRAVRAELFGDYMRERQDASTNAEGARQDSAGPAAGGD